MKTLEFIKDVLESAEEELTTCKYLKVLGYLPDELPNKFQEAIEYIEELMIDLK